jgi:hypothetical protein
MEELLDVRGRDVLFDVARRLDAGTMEGGTDGTCVDALELGSDSRYQPPV